MTGARTRVVVVGGGMVGTRFVADLATLDVGSRFDVTLLGDEPYEPYNRILLADVVAGAVDVASLTLPEATGERVRVHRGSPVVAVDRAARVARTRDGVRHPYDVLVLATGARARVPAVAGLPPSGDLPPGVHPLRTVDDCRELVAAAGNARRAAVLGGGVLGVEAARGLSLRGLEVTLVQSAGHLMERQLDAEAGAVLRDAAARVGITARTGARLQEVLLDREGRLQGLRLGGGEVLPVELLVLAVGVAPATALAAATGLPVHRGVVVDPDLRSPADPRVAAIGDCAEPPEGPSGLVADGWAQARRLAEQLTGAAAGRHRAASRPGVVLLKAAGLDVVTMGRRAREGDRAVRLSDRAGGRHLEVVVSGGALVGATCVGAPDVAADLTVAFDRGTPLPEDPAHLLVRPVAGLVAASEPASPTLMPDRATVCRCNGVTKGDVVQAWSGGARTPEAVAAATRATTGCGSCTSTVCGLLEWLADVDPLEPPTSQPPLRAGEEEVARGKRRTQPAETRAS